MINQKLKFDPKKLKIDEDMLKEMNKISGTAEI